jgi:hypothetical protein
MGSTITSNKRKSRLCKRVRRCEVTDFWTPHLLTLMWIMHNETFPKICVISTTDSGIIPPPGKFYRECKHRFILSIFCPELSETWWIDEVRILTFVIEQTQILNSLFIPKH